jgi:hypothetical protein
MNLEISKLRAVADDLRKFKLYSEERVNEINELKAQFSDLENKYSSSQVKFLNLFVNKF